MNLYERFSKTSIAGERFNRSRESNQTDDGVADFQLRKENRLDSPRLQIFR